MNNCTELTKNLQTISNEHKIVDSAISRDIPIKEGVSAKERIDQIIKIENSFEVGENFQLAEKLLGQDFIGPEQIKEYFDIELKPEEIPPIPFTIEQIRKAKKLGMFLVLRVNKDKNGKPITLNNFPSKENIINPRDRSFYNNIPFFKSASILIEWSLTTKGAIPGTQAKSESEQSDVIRDFKYNKFPDKMSKFFGTIPSAIELVYDFYLHSCSAGVGTGSEILSSSIAVDGFITIVNYDPDHLPTVDFRDCRDDHTNNKYGVCLSFTKK